MAFSFLDDETTTQLSEEERIRRRAVCLHGIGAFLGVVEEKSGVLPADLGDLLRIIRHVQEEIFLEWSSGAFEAVAGLDGDDVGAGLDDVDRDLLLTICQEAYRRYSLGEETLH